jgi:hypothetical protein
MMPPPEQNPLFQRNLDFLRRIAPEVANAVAICRFDSARLQAVGSDDWDLIKEDGTHLYGLGAREFGTKHVDAFWAVAARHRMPVVPPVNIADDIHANETLGRCLVSAKEANIAFEGERCDPTAAAVVVYGIGLGHHLPRLVEKSQCESIIVVEPNVEFLFYSLFVFDWRDFIERVQGNHGHVGFALSANPLEVASNTMMWINNHYPSLADGTLFYQHYASPIFQEMHEMFVGKFQHELTMGLGFLEDELTMITNTVGNLEHFEGRVFKLGTKVTEMPAFVVGSGPSFDHSLETIRRFADRALVLSCGTTLGLLLKNGVIPDIHCELENVPEAYDTIAACAKDHDFRETLLIGSSTIDPRIQSFFDETVFFFREGPATYLMFNMGDETRIRNEYPLVSNLAVSTAVEIGCTRVYLFGVDLGTKDVAFHHSKDSLYSSGDLEYPFQNEVELEGNFGGTVFSNLIYQSSIRIKELVAGSHTSDTAFFNCSDGARVEGFQPLPLEDVDIPAGHRTREQFRESVRNGFIRYGPSVFTRQWTDNHLKRDLHEFTDRLFAHPAWSGGDYAGILELLKYLTRSVAGTTEVKRGVGERLFRGSLGTAMGAIYFLLTRVAEADARNAFAGIARTELRALIERMRTRVVEKLAELGHSGT